MESSLQKVRRIKVKAKVSESPGSFTAREVSPQVKGIVGELIAREYLRRNGFEVWLLRIKTLGHLMRNLHYFTDYGGSGEEHHHIESVLTREEREFLSRTRIFDLLVVPRAQLILDKTQMERWLVDVKTTFEGKAHGWTPKREHKSRYLAALKAANRYGFQVKTLHLSLDLRIDLSVSDFVLSDNSLKRALLVRNSDRDQHSNSVRRLVERSSE